MDDKYIQELLSQKQNDLDIVEDQEAVSHDNLSPNDRDDMEKVQLLINDFCVNEYGEPADFNDLGKIDICHSSVYDDFGVEHSIQVSVDLYMCSIDCRLDGYAYPAIVKSYENLGYLVVALMNLTFDSLVGEMELIVKDIYSCGKVEDRKELNL